MIVGEPPFQYRWHDNWARIPETARGRVDGRTHGVVVLDNGDVVVLHQATPSVLIFDVDGTLKHAWGDFAGGHGLTKVRENGQEFLWIADSETGAVVKATPQGDIIQHIPQPDSPIYSEKAYSPTWVAVNGNNGDVWVADGYGAHLVHRYDKDGTYLASINGTEGTAGHFDCPHGIWIDERKAEPALYIADRSHCRIQVYDLEGRFKRVFGSDFLTSPCGFITHGDYLLIPELIPRIVVLDRDDRPKTTIGDNDGGFHIDGWPNAPVAGVHAGKFNAPHGIAANKRGDLFVVEWMIGGRITKLEKVT